MAKITSKPILISGGDGFIGRSLVRMLLTLNISVFVIDNHVTSYPPEIHHPLFGRIIEDISEINIDHIPECSGVIHLASVASPSVYMDNPLLVLKPNSCGTQKMIEIARRDGVRLLFASTSEVYGHLSEDLVGDHGIRENDLASVTLLSNRSCYSSSKRFGEELILDFKRSGGDATNLRFFNIYGPGMDTKNLGYGRVIPNFFYNMSKGRSIPIYGDGRQVRCFLWIDDAVEAILSVLFYKGALPSSINIGNNEPVTINDLAEKISTALSVKYQVEFCEIEEDDPLWRRPCTELINKLTGWSPKMKLDSGLQKIATEYIIS